MSRERGPESRGGERVAGDGVNARIRDAQRGDRRAFDSLVGEYRGAMIR